ncbi:MAG: DNA polymerase III subunit gamma/tau [Bacteroidetes bacterium]|nr:DNA polymerase III subunit gamma/tau [Fibrella sp.]
MDNFVVSARKYRPATFDTVVGQEHITTTLKNAIRTNHLASAFLFCGPRGVGKTTCARILAKAINCQNLTPEAEACDVCDSCVSFNQNASFNIHELDAASNNSVEDIRSLIEQVRVPPQSGAKYKIYIIDEVHMLSTAAFNAFLKTLEEPPTYAIFILATTEKHKILPTILSRCQIFDFNRIQPKDIADHLGSIAGKEHITVEYDALELIARKADGGLRDALSMFDLNVTFAADRTLRYKEVLNNLHILDYDYYFQLTDFLLAGNLSHTLLTLNEILQKGFDGHQFVVGLCRHFRDLLVCKDAATVQLLQVTESVQRQYLDQSARAPMSFLLSALSIGGQCDLHFKQARDQRLHVELTLMKLANLRNLLNWNTLPDEAMPGVTAPEPPTNDLITGESPVPRSAPNNAIPSLNGAEKKNTSPLTESVSIPNGTETQPLTSEPVSGYMATRNGTLPPMPSLPRPILTGTRLRSTAGITPMPGAIVNGQTDTLEPPAPRPVDRPDKSFDLDELQAVWRAFTQRRQQQTDNMTEQVVLNRDLTLDGTIIHLTLENRIQADHLTDIRPDLLGYLREQLQNRQIQVEHRIVAQENKKMIYSPQDKFNFLAQKNPALLNLRKTLGLEVDY